MLSSAFWNHPISLILRSYSLFKTSKLHKRSCSSLESPKKKKRASVHFYGVASILPWETITQSVFTNCNPILENVMLVVKKAHWLRWQADLSLVLANSFYLDKMLNLYELRIPHPENKNPSAWTVKRTKDYFCDMVVKSCTQGIFTVKKKKKTLTHTINL